MAEEPGVSMEEEAAGMETEGMPPAGTLLKMMMGSILM